MKTLNASIAPMLGAALLSVALIAIQSVCLALWPRGIYHEQPGWIFLLGFCVVAVFFGLSKLTALQDVLRKEREWPLSALAQKSVSVLIPLLFALVLLLVWEAMVVGFDVPLVLLPAPTGILHTFISSASVLWSDFQQTYLKSVVIGYVLGCSLGFVTAMWVVKSRFLQNALLPLGNFMSAIPIVGIAPIMVMWFGFDWPSKAAVVVIMTFFPMLINTLAGLQSVDPLHRDLMHTYAASKSAFFFKTQLPQAMPFVFNALKINSTLALIGAIVAEFFGTPIVGMGFRISTEVGRMNMDMVWATILVAALAGSLSYGALALLERKVTFWHASVRQSQ